MPVNVNISVYGAVGVAVVVLNSVEKKLPLHPPPEEVTVPDTTSAVVLAAIPASIPVKGPYMVNVNTVAVAEVKFIKLAGMLLSV